MNSIRLLLITLFIVSCGGNPERDVDQLEILRNVVAEHDFKFIDLQDDQILLYSSKDDWRAHQNAVLVNDPRASHGMFLDVNIEYISRIGHNIDFVVGSWIDDRVGYIWSPDGKISTDGLGTVKKIRSAWYQYDTFYPSR